MKAPHPDRYEHEQTFTARLNGSELIYISKPGLQDWKTIRPAQALLAEHAALPAGGRAFLYGSGHGALAVALARRLGVGELWVGDPSYLALEMTRRTLVTNQVDNVHLVEDIADLGHLSGLGISDFCLVLPKGRGLARRWLAQAFTLLSPGGRVWLSGANDQGVQSVIKDAESLFGRAVILDYKKGSRVARLLRPPVLAAPPAWLTEPGIAPGSWQTHPLQLPGQPAPLSVSSLPGVFSAGELDAGTQLLLETLQARSASIQNTRVLDVGCGVGVIGLWAALHGASQVDLIDVDLLAVTCTRQNMAAHAPAARTEVLPSDALSAVLDRRYDWVLTNPPFHAGQAVEYAMTHAILRQSAAVLAPAGQLVLVANRFIHYEALLREHFAQVSLLVETGRFHVWRASGPIDRV